MPFPSQYINDWFEYVQRVLEIKEEDLYYRFEEWLCWGGPFDIMYRARRPFVLPGEEISSDCFDTMRNQTYLIITYCFVVWINCVMRTVCDEKVYENFQETYPFHYLDRGGFRPEGQPGGQIGLLFKNRARYNIKAERSKNIIAVGNKQIQDCKETFWKDVLDWLENVGRQDIRDKAGKFFQDHDFPKMETLLLFEGDLSRDISLLREGCLKNSKRKRG